MLEARERIVHSQDWVTIILLMVIALIVYAKLTNNERFYRLQSLFFNTSYISEYSKTTPLLINVFNVVFYIISVLTISLTIIVIIQKINPETNEITIGFYFKTVVLVFLFTTVRYFVGALLGVLFENEKEQKYFSFLKLSYLSFLSLIITPLLIINFYSQSATFTSIFIVITLLLVGFSYFLIFKNNPSFIFKRMFYFILYLCALEIAPLLIIYKLIVSQGTFKI